MVKIELAPLNIPLKRRLQTTAVVLHTMTYTVMPLIALFTLIYTLLSQYYWLAIGYSIWIAYDVNIKKTSSRGSRPWQWFRGCAFWRYYRDYFPVHLMKTAELAPDKNYLCGYHPHGVIGCGAISNFATEATGFSKTFPGIKPHLMTLKPNFTWPILRAMLLWSGVCDVSKESINWILTKQGTGNAAIIVVGGAEEALSARPGNYDITLKHRKGFVKMAIKTGADLVPVFSFGENDLFLQADNPAGSKIRAFQDGFKKIFGFSPIFFYGRGIFNYTFGLVPYRKPIHTIMGRPISVPQDAAPDQTTVDLVHQQYMDELTRLFDEHKTEYGVDKDVYLNFV